VSEPGERSDEPDDRGWYVYVLRCADATLYTGITNRPAVRLERHVSGRGARYTRGRGPVELVYMETAADRSSALRRERAIKALDRGAKEALVRSGPKREPVPAPAVARPPGAAGVLYLCPTPVGNLEDITRRAERVLAEADLVLAEDTRHSGRLLQHLGLKKPLLSYHDQNEHSRLERVLTELECGRRVVLVSDAGSPVLSDPGYPLVRAAVERGLRVEALPGPTALVPALTASGLPPHPFRFVGFLPRTRPRRLRLFADLAADEATLVAYESPHRIADALADVTAAMGTRHVCVAREISKLHETYYRGTAEEVRENLPAQVVGEIVLVVAGAAYATGDGRQSSDDRV
jgi:16S rRNA (cytidine1402-2'-O)-methyltransferase